MPSGSLSRLVWISGRSATVRYFGTTSACAGTIRVARMPPRMIFPKAGFSLDRAYAAAVQKTSWRIQAPVACTTVFQRWVGRSIRSQASV